MESLQICAMHTRTDQHDSNILIIWQLYQYCISFYAVSYWSLDKESLKKTKLAFFITVL